VVFVTLQPTLIAQTAPENEEKDEKDENVTGGQNARIPGAGTTDPPKKPNNG
jgi:hypothetical protein